LRSREPKKRGPVGMGPCEKGEVRTESTMHQRSPRRGSSKIPSGQKGNGQDDDTGTRAGETMGPRRLGVARKNTPPQRLLKDAISGA